MIRPQLCTGPACPYCGCRDVQIPQQALAGSWYASGGAVCNYCRRRFAFVPAQVEQPTLEPIVYQEPPPLVVPREDPLIVRCPDCGERAGQYGKGPKVTSTRKDVRYFKCPCGCTFKRPVISG